MTLDDERGADFPLELQAGFGKLHAGRKPQGSYSLAPIASRASADKGALSLRCPGPLDASVVAVDQGVVPGKGGLPIMDGNP